MQLNSIRARMTLSFALCNAALMLLICGSILLYARHAAETRVAYLLQLTARHTQEELREPPGAPDVIRELSEDLKAEHLAILRVDANGHILQQSQRRIPSWPRQGNDGWRVTAVPAGAETLIIGYPWMREEEMLRHQALTLTGLSLAVVLASAIGAWLLVGRTLSPIGALSRQAQTASSENLRMQLAAPSRDAEVVELVATWNGLLARLAETAAQKGRFYAAASHELRTPLQALSGHLEVALSRARSEEEYRNVLAEASAQTRRLTSLTQDLLLLNRLETAPSPPPTHPVDLPDLCERLLQTLQPLATQRGLTIHTEFPPEAVLPLPQLHAEILLRNLLENAVKYAAPNGEVRVTLRTSPAETRLEISNTFPSDTPLDADRLFEPFFRPDAARNAETGGNGLGLAICKALALTNRWQLNLQQTPSAIRITVLFPTPT